MKMSFRWIAVVLFLTYSAACGPSPIAPRMNQQPATADPLPPPPPRTLIAFPHPSGPSRTFIFSSELRYPVQDFTKQSRFVLYDNGAFVLQYPNGAINGQYRTENGVIKFLFESDTGRSIDEAWDDATGTLNGDLLTVEYVEMMQHSDYENAVYRLEAS